MKIPVEKLIGVHPGTGVLVIAIPPAMNAEFREAIARAMLTWQDVSPEFRDFHDRLRGVEGIMGENMKAPLVVTIRDVPVVAYKCPECRTVPCSCTFKHY